MSISRIKTTSGYQSGALFRFEHRAKKRGCIHQSGTILKSEGRTVMSGSPPAGAVLRNEERD
ncbi:hypothetical protein LX59_01186 [Azomonas agilis]|uniref:Uncharacterized protein n=1 Tax=Azomonas agilis TaxID=116849 RepID=A0A562J0B7_9GAMM|nr:hypothetical protein LX59_01186 [Azomonas agilis]